MNSIIEAQITLREEQEKEIERCKDPLYFYENYIIINGVKVTTTTETQRELTRRRFNQITDPNPFINMSYRGINLLRPFPKHIEDINRDNDGTGNN